MQIIQIVPRLPPAVDGVGDYALTLARNLANHYGLQTTFVVCDPTNTEASNRESMCSFPVIVLPQRSARALAAIIQAFALEVPILLHYVQYGYARKGCPIWLDRGLHLLCGGANARPLVTMFHEIYAVGHFPDSAFWLKPVQKTIACRIARLSRACVTTRETYARELTDWLRDKGLRPNHLPIPSGVGEGAEETEGMARWREMVVFGLSSTRARAYRQFAPELERACLQLGIEKIIDIGPQFEPMPAVVGGVPVEAHGPLEAAAIRALLTRSLAGFLVYDLAYLGRSSVFAAYCAYGLAPVCIHTNRHEQAAGTVKCQDGLLSGIHFWENESHAAGPLGPTGAVRVAAAARAWYRSHDQTAHAELFHALLRQHAGPRLVPTFGNH